MDLSRSKWGVKGRGGVGAFTGLYLALSIVAAIRSGNGEFVFYIAVMFALIGLIWWVDRRIGLPVAALWALSVWGLVHMAGGLVSAPASWPTNVEGGFGGVLYNLWIIPGNLKYDQVVHAYGFGVTTWIWWLGLSAIVVGRLSELTRSDLQREEGKERESREAGSGVGRISEPAVQPITRKDRWLAPAAGPLFLCVCASMGLGAMNELVEFAATKLLPGTNVGGYDNTGWDLVANLTGCLIAASAIRVFGRSDLRADRAADSARI